MGDDQPFDFGALGGIPPETGQPGVPPDPNATPPGYVDPSAGWLPPGWGGSEPGAGPPPPPSAGGPGPYGWSGPPSPYGGPYGPPGPRGRSGATRAWAVLIGILLIAAAVLIPVVLLNNSNQASQAASLYKKSTQAAGNSAGVHYVSTWTGGGEPTTTFSGDAGQNDGTQVITEPTGYGTEQYDVLLAADQTVYFEGNAAALEDELGVGASAASGLAGKWVSLQPADGPFDEEEAGLTVGSEVGVPGFVASSTQTVNDAGGATLTEITGTVPATSSVPSATADVDISPSTDLPASMVVTYSDGTVNTVTFSDWGTAPAVTVPASAVVWSSLSTSTPPDGYGSGETPTPGAATPATPTITPSPSASGSAA